MVEQCVTWSGERLSQCPERQSDDRSNALHAGRQLILYSNAITLSGPYKSFLTLGQNVLEMLGTIRRVSFRPPYLDELKARMLRMPAHRDVSGGLEQFRKAGFRLVTLTDSPPAPEGSPLQHAGIDGWFERAFGVDSVRRFKPTPQVYLTVAEELGVPASAIRMVVAYDRAQTVG
jgi:2-haloacid dehalogenase